MLSKSKRYAKKFIFGEMSAAIFVLAIIIGGGVQ